MSLPVPLCGLLSSAQVLHEEHLEEVVAEAYRVANVLVVTKADAGIPLEAQLGVAQVDPAWRGAEVALLAYGLLCCRELEARGLADLRVVRCARTMVRALGLLRLDGRSPLGNAHHPRRGVPGALVTWREPSWMSVAQAAAHRMALLQGPHGEWYRGLGWGWFAGPSTLDVPPNDPAHLGPRWRGDTSKDWREPQPER